MPHKPRKVLILGSGALKIGEAGEFDYSGSQAIKAIKDEGIATVLVNPNIATIQTSEYLADQIYLLPVNPYFVERVIEKERPDGILLGFGGQTALNCGLMLEEKGVLERHHVSVLGTPIHAIRATEDRQLFADKLDEIGVKVPRSRAARSVDEALAVAESIGYPVMLRVGFALGGLGSGQCRTAEEVRERATRAFAHSGQVLVEEYLLGWKEVEYEVVRDQFDNCVTVCNMENFDPLGIHTGESIVVAPSQTLSDREYHRLREIALKVVRHLGVVGECNIQYALDPRSDDYRVIEVNARLSRSSALASKATGYPLALVAAKLALGYSLADLRNAVTGVTSACFEPALDYLVVKVPRWDLRKFRRASTRIGSAMKSVGEVMAIGRKFEEALQKALRMLDIGVCGLVGDDRSKGIDIERELREPTSDRIFAIAAAFRAGYSVERVHELTFIHPWFLEKIRGVVETGEELRHTGKQTCPPALLRKAKQRGFADRQIAKIWWVSEDQVRERRRADGITPVVKRIDTLAAEYPARTNCRYLTYNGTEDDVEKVDARTIAVLGSGAYRIGSSVEFDWCSVNSVRALGRAGYRTVVINCNPETVSTDYNECDVLYFDELSVETVLTVCEKEPIEGVVVSVGGQTPNNMVMPLHHAGVRVLGTSPLRIDTAEDRHRFSALLDQLDVAQPEWKELDTLDDAKAFANRVGYPVLVRPSYVLSGAAMSVASNDRELVEFLERAADVSPQHPVVMTAFIENAKELELDGVASRGEVVVSAISEHVENAGVHSGDATLVFPPQRTYLETMRRIQQITKKVVQALEVDGPFNIQFIAKGNDVKVIECNLRASRSFPFVSKILNVNFIDIAIRSMLGQEVPRHTGTNMDLGYVGVKAPQFSFTRLEGADPTLGVEMVSTGEVACLGHDFEEAFLKALLSVGYRLPVSSVLLSSGPVESKAALLKSTRMLQEMGIKLYSTQGTSEFLRSNGIETTPLRWPLDPEGPNVVEYLRQGKIDVVVNIPKNYQEEELTNDYMIRRQAVDFGVPLITNVQLAQRFVEALSRKRLADLEIKGWGDYVFAEPQLA